MKEDGKGRRIDREGGEERRGEGKEEKLEKRGSAGGMRKRGREE